MTPPRRILFIGSVFPEPVSSAAGVRTDALVRDFVERGDRVLFASPSDRNGFAEALRARGVETAQVGPNDPAFDALARDFAPDVAIFDRFMLEEQFGWRVAEAAPEAIRVLDTIDLHFLRRWRGDRLRRAMRGGRGSVEGGASVESGLPVISDPFAEGASVPADELAELFVSDPGNLVSGPDGIETDDCLREIAAIFRSDIGLILSSFEMRLLRDRFRVPEPLLLELGFSYDAPARELRPAFSERRHFVSIGNFRHPPNRDSAFWMARTLWPRIRARLEERGERDAELHLYGAYPPKEIMALDDRKAGIRVFGPAEDAIAALRGYRALLAPLRFGAGIKGKIADAWSAGIPVVTTPIVAEGMTAAAAAGFAGIVARSEADIVDSAAVLHSDGPLQARLVAEGDRAIEELYSPEANRRKLFDRLDRLSDPGERARARAANVVGRMLRSDSLARTKYFSMWIEAKGRAK